MFAFPKALRLGVEQADRSGRSGHSHPLSTRYGRRVGSVFMIAVWLVAFFAPQASFASTHSAVTPAAVTVASACPSVIFIGARGSGEKDAYTIIDPTTGQKIRKSSGLGPELDGLYDQLSADLTRQLPVSSLFVVYPAANVDVLKLSTLEKVILAKIPLLGPGRIAPAYAAFAAAYYKNHVQVYLKSINAGIKSASDELMTEAKQCPNARFVLGGYSQGALVMHQLLLNLSDKNDVASQALLRRITATALIADPGKKSETAAMHFGTADLAAQGIKSFLTFGERDVPTPSSTYDICNLGDIVCDFSWPVLIDSAGFNVHTNSYQNNQMVRDIGSKIAKTLLQQLPGVVDHLDIAPATATVPVGTPQTYSATAVDPSNKPLGDVTAEITFAISPDGSCQGSVCTPALPGQHVVKGVRNLVTGTATLTAVPVHPPAGDVVYSAQDTNGTNIWVRHATDGSTVQLTTNTGHDPDVSPDGSKIAYIAPDPHALAVNESSNITWVMNSDGSNAAPLDPQSQVLYYDSFPRWSPDGTHISVERSYAWDKAGYNNNNGYKDIFVLAASGGTAQVITSDHQSSGPASWSPDGGRLAYYSYPAGLTVVNKDGSNVHLVAMAENTTSYSPEWAPGGDRIYVDTDTAGIMYFSSADRFATPTSVLRARLLPGPVFRDLSPRASADGNTILFVGFDRCAEGTNTCSAFNLFTVSSSGGVPTMLTSTTGAQSASFIKK